MLHRVRPRHQLQPATAFHILPSATTPAPGAGTPQQSGEYVPHRQLDQPPPLARHRRRGQSSQVGQAAKTNAVHHANRTRSSKPRTQIDKMLLQDTTVASLFALVSNKECADSFHNSRILSVLYVSAWLTCLNRLLKVWRGREISPSRRERGRGYVRAGYGETLSIRAQCRGLGEHLAYPKAHCDRLTSCLPNRPSLSILHGRSIRERDRSEFI